MNTLIFSLAAACSAISRRWFKTYPRFWYNVLAWMGVYAFLDPIITLIFDICYANWDGDFFKFYNHFNKVEGNGTVGAYITVFLMLTYLILSGYAFYYYMVFRYMNGRILDLYRRLSGQYKAFFLPLDNEISLKYL